MVDRLVDIPDNKVNSQVIDSAETVHLLTIAQASPQSVAIVEAVGSETIGASMHNAVKAQQNAQMMAGAALAATCARIVGAQLVVPYSDVFDSSPPSFDTSPSSDFSPPADLEPSIEEAVQELREAVDALNGPSSGEPGPVPTTSDDSESPT